MIQIIESGLQPLSFRFRWRRRRKAAGKKNERFEKITKQKSLFRRYRFGWEKKKGFFVAERKVFSR